MLVGWLGDGVALDEIGAPGRAAVGRIGPPARSYYR